MTRTEYFFQTSTILFFNSEIFLFFSILFLFILGIIINRNNKNFFYYNNKIIKNLSLLILIIYIYKISQQHNVYNSININTVLISHNSVFYSPIIQITKMVLGLLTLWIISQKKILKISGIFFFEIDILFLISLLSFSLMLMFNDLILIFLFIELQSLIFFILSSVQRKIISFDAGLKYFIFGVIASSFILYGISIFYGIFGTINLHYLGIIFETLYQTENYLISDFYYCFIFIIIGVLIKIGAFPFYYWIPQIYEGSILTITAYFSSISYISYSILLLNFFFQSCYYSLGLFTNMLWFVCIGSIIVGIMGALYQTKIKKFMAYNSIFNIGFIFLGILNIFLAKNIGLNMSLIFIFIFLIFYSFMNTGLWNIFLSSIMNKKSINYLNELKILYKYNSTIIYAFIVALISISGLPPTVGFLIKFFLIGSAVTTNFKIFVFIILVSSLLSIFYYLRIIKVLLFDFLEINKSIIFQSLNFNESFNIAINFHFLVYYVFYFNIIVKLLKGSFSFFLVPFYGLYYSF